MGKKSIAPTWFPSWDLENQGSTPGMSNIIFDADGEKVVMVGAIRWEDGGINKSLATVHYRNANGSFSGTIQVAIRGIDAAGPTLRDDGGNLASVDTTYTSPNAATSVSATFTTPLAGVDTGDVLCLVIEATDWVSGSFRPRYWLTDAGTRSGRSAIMGYTGGVWAVVAGTPMVTFEATDGTRGIFTGCFPAPGVAEIAAVTLSTSGTTEAGLLYTPPMDQWLSGVEVCATPAAGGAFDVCLYEGTTLLWSYSVDPDTLPQAAAYSHFPLAVPETLLTKGTDYILSVKATTANNVTVYSMESMDTTDLEVLFAKNCGYVFRTGTGAWDESQLFKMPPLFCLAINAIDSLEGTPNGYYISGTVTLASAGVSGAVIRCVNQTTGEVYTGTTNGSGDYSVEVEGGSGQLYHVTVEYTSGGTDYNAPSLWDVAPALP